MSFVGEDCPQYPTQGLIDKTNDKNNNKIIIKKEN